MKNKLMIYGANGFSADLIIRELLKRNTVPVLAGRNEKQIKKMAAELDCPYSIFDLDRKEDIRNKLTGIHTLLNCAGPFKYTAEILMKCCLEASANYVDITGEIPVIKSAWDLNKAAEEKGVVILPAAGFDVIPTDCLASRLSSLLKDPDSLELGLLNQAGKISGGTFKTTMLMMREKGFIRKDGELIESEIGEFTKELNCGNFKFSGISIPWGDLITAYHSTNIPNIKVFLGLPRMVSKNKFLVNTAVKMLRIPFINNTVIKLAGAFVKGPAAEEEHKTKTYVWGRVGNKEGDYAEEVYRFMEPYKLTSIGAAVISLRILNNEVEPGTKTPSLAFGSKFMDEFILEKVF